MSSWLGWGLVPESAGTEGAGSSPVCSPHQTWEVSPEKPVLSRAKWEIPSDPPLGEPGTCQRGTPAEAPPCPQPLGTWEGSPGWCRLTVSFLPEEIPSPLHGHTPGHTRTRVSLARVPSFQEPTRHPLPGNKRRHLLQKWVSIHRQTSASNSEIGVFLTPSSPG